MIKQTAHTLLTSRAQVARSKYSVGLDRLSEARASGCLLPPCYKMETFISWAFVVSFVCDQRQIHEHIKAKIIDLLGGSSHGSAEKPGPEIHLRERSNRVLNLGRLRCSYTYGEA